MTTIEWTNETWNPIAGCTRVSPGCQRCYAERLAKRLAAMGQEKYQGLLDHNGRWNGVINVASNRVINHPLTITKPTKWFVNSMSDLFHENLAYSTQDRIFTVMAEAKQHIFQVLTKRPENFAEFFDQYGTCPPNVWLGVSVESQAYTSRIPPLLATDARVKFLSCEPLLDKLDLRPYLLGLQWVIVGGESGPGARPMQADWARIIRNNCRETNTPFFFKQWGETLPMFQKSEFFQGYYGGFGENFIFFEPSHEVPDDLEADKDFWGHPFEKCGPLFNVNNVPTREYKSNHTGLMVGKKKAGRLLDGKEYNEMPQVNPC